MTLVVAVEPAGSRDVSGLLREYVTEVIDRYVAIYGGHFDVDETMAADPSDHLVMLVARLDGVPIGCGGLLVVDRGVAEIKRVFVAGPARGQCVADAIMGALEAEAVRRGLQTARLDTRADLVEARRLYARLGYAEVEPFNDGPYADHWFAKSLVSATRGDLTDDALIPDEVVTHA